MIAALTLLSLSAHADEKIGDSHFYTKGDLRWIGALPPDLVINDEGGSVDQGPVLDQRIRLGGGWKKKKLRLALEGDMLEGQALGDTWSLGPGDDRNRDSLGLLGEDAFSLREASVTVRLPRLQVAGGAMMSHWGLGMIANDGAHDPLFGRSDFGDRVLRVRVTGVPIKDAPLYLTIAGDRGIEDEIGAWADGQRVYQGIASALWQPDEGPTAGVYGVYRDQLEADGVRRTQVSVVDLFAEVPVSLSDAGHSLTVSVEGAGFMGSTDRASTYNSPDGLEIRAANVAARAVAALPDERALLHLRGGYGTGDGDPDDGQLNEIAFDRDFDAGMVLFDEVQGALAAANYRDITDPANAGSPPDGADGLLTEGAVQKATYAQVAGEVRPQEWLGVKLGALVAWQTAPIGYAFESYRAGGVPTNQLGVATEGYHLGTEIDWAVRLGGNKVGSDAFSARPELLLQGGHLLPSEALAAGETQTLLMASGRVRW